MESKLVLLLDVDGVICPTLDPDASLPAFWPAWTRGAQGLEHLHAATAVLQFLRQLESETVEVLWHTSWRQDAQTRLAPAFGLPEWELATSKLDVEDDRWWKLTAPARLLGEGRTVLWLDDDLSYSWKQGELAHFVDQKLIALSPAWDEGLRPFHLEAIEEAIAGFRNSCKVAFDPTRRI